MKRLAALVIIAFTAVFMQPSCLALDGVLSGSTYLYNRKGEEVASPSAYLMLKSVVLTDDKGKKADAPSDVFYSDAQKIYVVDTGGSRILIYDNNINFTGEVSQLKMADGAQGMLNKPEGIFVTPGGELLIADTGNNRVVRCDELGVVKQIINKPQGLTGIEKDAPFYPVKLVSDSAGRIYIIARNINMGIVQLSADGTFIGYMGAPKVQLTVGELFWRSISTKAQKARMQQFVPTEYSNIAIDAESFLYGTISSVDEKALESALEGGSFSGNTTPIRKLNTMGDDVLKRSGAFPPVGDLRFQDSPSRMTDVAFAHHGIYTLLDSAKGKLFTYDDNGNLLAAFGGLGQNRSLMQRPVSLVYSGDDLLVLDSLLGELFVYRPTNYGKKVVEAVSAQYDGDFEKAYTAWKEIASDNLNFEYAFVGLGNAYMQDGKYSEAMGSFRYAGDKDNFSKAKGLLRNEQMKKAVPVIIVCLIAAIILWGILSVVIKIVRYCKGGEDDERNRG